MNRSSMDSSRPVFNFGSFDAILIVSFVVAGCYEFGNAIGYVPGVKR